MKETNVFNFNDIVSVERQERQYSALVVGSAKRAQKLQEMMGFISEIELLRVIDNNLILDSLARRQDIVIAKDIFGINTSLLKGKSSRKTEKHAKEDVILDVPQYILA